MPKIEDDGFVREEGIFDFEMDAPVQPKEKKQEEDHKSVSTKILPTNSLTVNEILKANTRHNLMSKASRSLESWEEKSRKPNISNKDFYNLLSK